VAQGHRPQGRPGRHPARRLQLRRLPALRSHRALQPHHAVGHRLRRERRPRDGHCNGFQTLVEAGLLPGGLIRNTGLKFVCRYVNLRVETTDTPFTSACETGELLRIVVKHNEGNYTVDPETFARLQADDQIVLRYANAAGERAEGANPNGALDDIAGVCNEARNVFGMMPHPENSVEAELAGGAGGRKLFQSIIDTVLRTAEVTS